jgi:hypothetical protein
MDSVGSFEGCKSQHCASACGVPSDDGGSGDADVDGGTESSGTSDASSGGGGSVTFSCTQTTAGVKVCSLESVASSQLHAAQQTCTSHQGTTGTTCSTTGLAGCCKTSVITEACYYDAAPATDQMTCAKQGGTWSTTP